MSPAGKRSQSISFGVGTGLVLATLVLLPMAPAAPAATWPDKDKLATGKPETLLSGIRAGVRAVGTHLPKGTSLARIRRMYGPETSKEDAVVPDGAGGTRFYTWQWPGLKLRVATYFTYRKLAHPHSLLGGMMESRVAYIDVWGDAPRGLLGTTGQGLALGGTLEQQRVIYGDHFWVSSTGSDGTQYVEMAWEDGTFLTIDYAPNGRINHIRLTARER